MNSIFLSYRRADTQADVGRLFDRLRALPEFRDSAIFHDVDSIAPGQDFMKRIGAAIEVSDVLVAVIGPGWLSAQDDEGRRRIDAADDAVRFEIACALERGVPVLPLLVRGAGFPGRDDLPANIEAMTERNALTLDQGRYDFDFEKLIGALRRLAAEAPQRSVGDGQEVGAEDFYALGTHYLHGGNYLNARQVLNAAIALDPELASAYVGLATASQLEAHTMLLRHNFGVAKELLEQSEELLKEALQHEDASAHLFVQMGYTRKEIAQVYSQVPQALRLAHAALAAEEAEPALLEKARTHFRMALGIDESDESAWNGLGSLALMARDHEEAIRCTRKALELNDDYSSARSDLAQALFLSARAATSADEYKGRFQEFLTVLGEIAARQADDHSQKLPDSVLEHLTRLCDALRQDERFTGAEPEPEG